MRLKDKKALITGGSEGIGFAIAQAFVKEGAKVVIVGRSLKKLQKAEQELGGNVIAIAADVTKIDELDRMYEKAGLLDIVVANAGTSQATPLAHTSEEDFDRLMSVNLKGVFFTVQRSLPFVRSGGSVILIASMAGKAGTKNFSAYCATKAGVISFAQSFASELVEKKIRVNSLSPGVVKTPILETAGIPEETLKGWSKAVPMHRFAQPKEIAGAAIFLASDESSYMTAADLAVDGGLSGISPL